MSPDLLINLIGPRLGLPRLPAKGLPLRQTFVSHLAVEGVDPEALIGLLRALLVKAASRDLDQLLLGLGAGHSWHAPVRRNLRHREYRSRLYLGHWPEEAEGLDLLDRRPVHMELAFL